MGDDTKDLGILENYVSIIPREPMCNPEWVAYPLYVRNSHNKRKIKLTIEIRPADQPTAEPVKQEHTVEAGQEIYLGCPIPGPTGQRFDYKITKPEWA